MAKSVYAALLERLVGREIEPGERIGVDRLVGELNISQTPIRSALSQLEAQGLVVKTHLSGYRAAPAFNPKDFEDLYRLRLLLEPKIAAAAAVSHTSAQLKRILESAARAENLQRKASPKRFNRFARYDFEFHSLLAAASNNRFFEAAVLASSIQLHLFRRGYNPHWLSAAAEEHRAVIEAVQRRNPEAAKKAMMLHLKKSYARYKKTL